MNKPRKPGCFRGGKPRCFSEADAPCPTDQPHQDLFAIIAQCVVYRPQDDGVYVCGHRVETTFSAASTATDLVIRLRQALIGPCPACCERGGYHTRWCPEGQKDPKR